jgi:hypothetical protein
MPTCLGAVFVIAYKGSASRRSWETRANSNASSSWKTFASTTKPCGPKDWYSRSPSSTITGVGRRARSASSHRTPRRSTPSRTKALESPTLSDFPLLGPKAIV